MNNDQTAILTLAAYLAVAAIVMLWQALHWPDGPEAWLLSVVNRLYLRSCFHWRSNRPCPLPQHGPAIVIANHSSPLDPMIIWMGQRRVYEFPHAREYYELPVVHWISKAMCSIPVDRDGKDLTQTREALRRLKAGRIVGVFPEGYLNRESTLLPGNPGMAWLALRSKVPIYPVYVHNAPGGESMVEPFYNFSPVRVSFGDPVDLSVYYSRRLKKEVLSEVTDLLMSRIAALGGVDYQPISSTSEQADTIPLNETNSSASDASA